jgi:hypothetical protein
MVLTWSVPTSAKPLPLPLFESCAPGAPALSQVDGGVGCGCSVEERGSCCSRDAAERAVAEGGAAGSDTVVIGDKVLGGGATDG